jgi:hypothetical protein
MDTSHPASALPEQSVPKPFEYVFVVLVSGEVVWPNKQIHKLQVNQIIIDQ